MTLTLTEERQTALINLIRRNLDSYTKSAARARKNHHLLLSAKILQEQDKLITVLEDLEKGE